MFVVCNADKTCSLPTCTDEPCLATTTASGTTPSVPESATGSGIAVTCATGYSTSETATCNPDNSWSLLPECTACDGENEYADVTGLAACKACPAGSAGVTESGGAVALDGPHTACTDSTCELPTARAIGIDSNAVIGSPCPDHGSHGGGGGSPDTCTLGCKPSYSGGVIWTCKVDSNSLVNASYQGDDTDPWCVGESVTFDLE